MAWAYSTCLYLNSPLMDAISSASIRNISEFDCQSIGNTAFAFASLRMLNRPLMSALSSEALRKIHKMEAQCVAVLTELELPGIEPLDRKLEEVADYIWEKLPPTLESWRDGGYPRVLTDLEVDHLGAVGSTRILQRLMIKTVPEADFMSRAMTRFPFSDLGDVARSWDSELCNKPTARRAYAYGEWDLHLYDTSKRPPWVAPLRGSLLRENGFMGKKPSQRFWLRPSVLPNNPYVDHSYCAEYQVLTEMCELIVEHGLADRLDETPNLSGSVKVLVSTTPCLSCVCVCQQFRLVFTRVEFTFAQLRPWEVEGSYGGAPKWQV